MGKPRLRRASNKALTGMFLLCGLCGSIMGADEPQAAAGGGPEKFWPAVSMTHTRAVLSSKLDENVATVVVEEGNEVKKGDALVKFDARQMEARLAAAVVDADFEARLQSAQTRYDYLKREFMRSEKLQAKEMLSSADYDKDLTQKELAGADLLETQRSRDLAVKRLELYKAQAEDYTVRSPIDGVVSQVWIKSGEMANVGQKLVEVIDPRVIELRVHLPEEHVVGFSCKWQAKVRFKNVAGREFDGEVNCVSPFVDSSSGTCMVKVLVRTQTDDVKPGMECDVKFVKPGTQ